MSPHQDGQLPTEHLTSAGFRGGQVPSERAPALAAYLAMQDGLRPKSFIFDAPCPGCGKDIEWYADVTLAATVPGPCPCQYANLPGVRKLREVAERIARGESS